MQKERLSALMDGETVDNGLADLLSSDKELQKRWQSYHLIRDVLRGNSGDILHLNIASGVAAALEKEPVRQPPVIMPGGIAQQPRHGTLFWPKVRPWVNQLVQVGVAVCVSLAVIVGVQHYNQSSVADLPQESPVFNTLPMMGMASPVSFGALSENISLDNNQQQVQEQRRRVNMMLKNFELQRHLYSDRLLDQPAPPWAAVQVSTVQPSATQ